MNDFDMLFGHIEGAVRCLKEGDSAKALRLLEMIRGHLAAAALKETNADVRSIHYHNLIKVILEKYPPEDDYDESH